MEVKRGLRHKGPVSYEISSDSEGADSPSAMDSSFSSPEKPRRKRISIVDIDDELEEIDEPPKTPPPRISAAGHSLRQHGSLHQSLRALQNGDKQRVKKRRISQKVVRKPKAVHQISSRPQDSLSMARSQTREQIATITTSKRANFFVAHKDIFLPLLPDGNYIQRLVDQRHQAQEQKEEDLSVPYVVIQQQPVGVKAVMKPYQLLGLSFLVYLHRNGLSGILGDEMGLGKTLQTLSFVQYLKENRGTETTTSQNRPCLVVCPLSVLNSWLSEAKKWTPELKVLRFHGSKDARDRLKKVATGEIDIYGNETQQARKKRNDRLTASGKPIIDLDSDSDKPEDEGGVDIIITTYEGYLAEDSWFKKAFVWNYVVLDEGHKIKNDTSLISKALQGLGAEYRLILTGTPLQNNLLELWALLHWLYPEVFTERTAELFKSSFNLTKGQVSTEFMDNARRLLEIIMLRRMKASTGVDLNLPPKTDVLLYVPLTPMQRFWYERLLSRTDQGLLEEMFRDAHDKEARSLENDSYPDEILSGKRLEELEALENHTSTDDSGAVTQWYAD